MTAEKMLSGPSGNRPRSHRCFQSVGEGGFSYAAQLPIKHVVQKGKRAGG